MLSSDLKNNLLAMLACLKKLCITVMSSTRSKLKYFAISGRWLGLIFFVKLLAASALGKLYFKKLPKEF